MSGIQLSTEMVSDIRDVLIKHDPSTENDMFFMQYLAAIKGYVLAHQTQPGLDKRELLSDLHEFSGQVLDQMEQDLQEQDSRQQPAQEEAFGIWKPE
jgi:hypothetical protein